VSAEKSKSEIMKEFFKEVGAKGGRARAKKYGPKQRSEWSRMAVGKSNRVKNAVPKSKWPKIVKVLLERQGTRDQDDFAKEIGCSSSYVNKVLKGAMSPGPKILRYLARIKMLKELGLQKPSKAA
jgi:hypothetical protein